MATNPLPLPTPATATTGTGLLQTRIELFKTLTDGNRLRALLALRHGELCVCELMELLALAASTVSRHMDLLRRAGLVQARKDGRWVYYRLCPTAATLETDLLALLERALAGDATIEQDRQRLNAISNSGKTPCPKC